MLSVPLRHSCDPTPSCHLEFDSRPLNGAQARHINRYALFPNLDLTNFRCRAVIDFVEVTFETVHLTDFKAIRRWIADKLGVERQWCRPIDGAENSSRKFSIRLHDPTNAIMSKIETVLASTKAGLVGPPQLSMLEVSIDFYPRDGSQRGRDALVGMLQRTYLPPPDVWKHGCYPRFVFGEAKHTVFLLHNPKAERMDHHARPNEPFLDATEYFGERAAPWMIRIQNKITDQRRRDSVRHLADEEKRARIEVTLTGRQLDDIGLNSLSDLAKFRFSKLQGQFFHFALPTFQEKAQIACIQAVVDEINNRDAECFLLGGVVCLERKRYLRERWFRTPVEPTAASTSHVRNLANALAIKGVRLHDRRNGSGIHGTTVAFKQLNQIVSSALHDLERRTRA